MKITRRQLRQIIRENVLTEEDKRGRRPDNRTSGGSRRRSSGEPEEYDDMAGVEIPADFGTPREDPTARAAADVGEFVQRRETERTERREKAEKIAKLKDPARKKEYFYRLDGDILSAFNKETGAWSSEPDKWSQDQKIDTLNKDMQQPMRDMLEDLNGKNWNLRELGKYHHNDESGDLQPMPTPGTAEYEEFKRKAYTPGAEGAWAWQAKIHRGWRDHKTQAELKADGPGASYSLHTVLDAEGQPAALAADLIDRRYAWGGSRAPQFWNALRIAAHNTGKLKVDIPVKDPAHVIHTDYLSKQAKTIDDATQEVMASLKQELETVTGEA